MLDKGYHWFQSQKVCKKLEQHLNIVLKIALVI